MKEDILLINPINISNNDIITEGYLDSKDYIHNENNKQTLKCKEWNNLNKKDEILNYINEIKSKINEKEIEELKYEIEKNDINLIFENYIKYLSYKIGGLNNIDILIFREYSDNPNFSEIKGADKSKLQIYKFRNIAGDGNCFYRGVIFYFLENIILSNNIYLMKEFIKLFDEKIDVEDNFLNKNKFIELKSEEKNKIINILYILLEYMEEKNKNAYTFFLQVFLFEKIFDNYIIFFTKYLIYEFILSNENKLYPRNDNLNIKELLIKENIDNLEIKKLVPEKYFGKPLQTYYINHLLKMNEMAESLDILIIPYVFQCDLNIRQLKCEYNEINNIDIDNIENIKIILDEDKYEIKCGLNATMDINLVYNGIHYDIFYKKDYYNKYCQQLDILINIFDFKIIKEKNFLNPHVLDLYSKYLKYLQSNNISNTDEELEKFFTEKDKVLINYINENGYDLKNIISHIKKSKCVYCSKNIQNNKYFRQFPCGCVICTKECFEQYKKPKINEDTDEKENGKYYDHITVCNCEYENKKKDIKKIILGNNIDNIDEIKDNDIKDENYRKIVENHWLWKCNFCKNDSFNRRYRFYRLIFKEKNPFTNNSLEHLICFTCKNTKIEKEKIIKCHYCDENHTISSIKNVSEDNEIESSCHIM